MKIVKPSIDIIFHLPEKHDTPEQFLEAAGRTCYKSEDLITDNSADKFISMLVRRGHTAMLEHCVASARLICDRGVTHELVRHRLASYAQESTRYCDYTKDKHGNEVSFIQPPGLTEQQRYLWMTACGIAENHYIKLREHGAPPQIARAVLPICVKTEIVITANLREWMHIFSLRCSPAAHPQIRALMLQALDVFAERVPSMFEEIRVFMSKPDKK